jgi:hypothetical protein
MLCYSQRKWPTIQREEIAYRPTHCAANVIEQTPVKKDINPRNLCRIGDITLKMYTLQRVKANRSTKIFKHPFQILGLSQDLTTNEASHN